MIAPGSLRMVLRRLIWLGALAVLVRPWHAGAAAPGDVPWFQRCLVGMDIDPTGAEFGIGTNDVDYASNYDGREVARRCKEVGVEFVILWARDGE